MARGTVWSLSLLRSLHKYREEGLFCDTRLQSVDGEPLAAHSCVLAASSATLCQKLTDTVTPSNPYHIQTSLTYKVLSWVVEYVYSGSPLCHDNVDIHASDILTAITELGLNLPELEMMEGVGTLNDWEPSFHQEGHACKSEVVADCERTCCVENRPESVQQPEIWANAADKALDIKIEAAEHASDTMEPQGIDARQLKKKRPRRKTTPKKAVRVQRLPSDDDTDSYVVGKIGVSVRKLKNRKAKPLNLIESSTEESGHDSLYDPEEDHTLLKSEERPIKTKGLKEKKEKVKKEKRPTKNVVPRLPGKPKERTYRCEVCAKTFYQKNHLQQHAKTHALRAPHLCRFCGQIFTRKTDMHAHERKNHSAEEQFHCKSCNESFTDQTELTEHKKLHVGGNRKEYSCSICNRVFNRRLHLLQHSRLHTGERPFVCGFCGKAFTVRHNLTAHERIHTGEKPYKCSYCNMSFNQRSVLVQHERRHTGEKPFQCQYCDKSFAARHYVLNHERIHTGERPYQCSFCGSAFKKKDNLRVHERTHTGERPFKCKFCPESFAIGHNLNVHERIHTGDRPYVCKTCGEAFCGRQALVSHEKQHSADQLQRSPTQPVAMVASQQQHPPFPGQPDLTNYGGGPGRPVYWTSPP